MRYSHVFVFYWRRIKPGTIYKLFLIKILLTMESFLKRLPKIELHAHLNGSLNVQSIKDLGKELYGGNSQEFLKLCQNFVDFNNTDLSSCFLKFNLMHELTSTVKGLQLACEMVIRNFSMDNVIYLELRTTPKVNENMTRRVYVETLINNIKENSIRYNIKVKLLLSIDRAQAVENAKEIVNLAIEFNAKYPDTVKGLDFSGNPYKGKFQEFFSTLSLAKKANLNVVLHCAEVCNTEEVEQMMDFGFQRCGHGTHLSQAQLQHCRNHDITIECCLTSNVKCGTVKSYNSHHFGKIFKSNIKTVLCTDDCGVFDTTLTQEFILASKYFDLNKSDIYTLSINAIKASFASKDEKCILTQCIDNYFGEKVTFNKH